LAGMKNQSISLTNERNKGKIALSISKARMDCQN